MTQTPYELAISELTDAQAAAVNWTDGAMLVLAGPGSGKTRVLTTRVAKLLADSPKRSFRVLALTFTNKAADEMSARVTLLVPDQEKRALIGTFHSFCMQMLQQHGSHIKINPDFAIYSLESDRQELIKEAIRKGGLPQDDARFLSTIDKLKGRLIKPDGCARLFKDPSVGQRVEAAYLAYETISAR
jgi:DNA helicase II / ATP-dependent DNA helicase PcrA